MNFWPCAANYINGAVILITLAKASTIAMATVRNKVSFYAIKSRSFDKYLSRYCL